MLSSTFLFLAYSTMGFLYFMRFQSPEAIAQMVFSDAFKETDHWHYYKGVVVR